jgi:mycothiol synthase
MTPQPSLAPPPGYTMRPPLMDDAEEVAALKRAALAGRREGDVTVGWVVSGWSLPRQELGRDAWLVFGPDGDLAAHAFLFEDQPGVYQRIHDIHPAHEGRGLEGYLLDVAEARARARGAAAVDGDVKLTVVAYESEADTVSLYAARGYEHIRTFARLAVPLDRPPQAPQAPPGIAIRRFRKDRDERAFYEALDEAFVDHWEPTAMTFEEWLRCDFEGPDVDLSLWWLAWDGDEVAGVLIGESGETEGTVADLGVRRPWRGRGLARALLLIAFAEFRRRGLGSAGLGVDTLNPTGALHLYTSLGMTEAGEPHLVYRRALPRS